MIWNEESVDVISANLDELIAAAGIENVYEDAPSYIFGKNWTDELRIKNGFTLIDNEWKKVIIVKDYWSTVIHDIKTLLKEKSRLSEDLQLQKRKLYEMEYGLRVAQKSLNKALNMTGDENE